MPLYEYSCPKCGQQFEELIRAADADKVKCPKCKTRAERKFSTFGVAMAPAKSTGAPGGGCASCPGAAAAGGSCPYK